MITNKQAPTLYAVVKDKIFNSIQSGSYKIGDKIPTEAEFCNTFSVSRTTVRQALHQLELDGCIEKVQGKGTFVTQKKIQHHLFASMTTFSEFMLNQGHFPTTEVLSSDVIPAQPPIDEILNIPKKSPVTKLVRLRCADGDPVHYETAYIPWEHAPGLVNDDLEQSLFNLLRRKYHLDIRRSVERFEAILSDEVISQSLKIPVGSPCFSVTTITYTNDDIPIEYNCGILRGDFSRLVIERVHAPSPLFDE